MCTVFQKPKVLLVEDSQDDAFFFFRSLRKTGISCDCVQVWDGGAATIYLRENQNIPHLVFLDVKMPVLSGFEVLKCLQGQSFKSRMEIIILSGSCNSNDVAEAQRLGAGGYVVKPVSVPELTQTIRMWLDKVGPLLNSFVTSNTEAVKTRFQRPAHSA
jgi:DNA-binding response OmpR family regulator